MIETTFEHGLVTRAAGCGARGRLACLALAVLLVCLSAGPGGAGAVVAVTPHRAVYALELGKIRSNSNVTRAEGRLEYEWDDVCDGWSVRQKTLLTVVHRNGQEVQSNWTINSWESKDGLRYRFYVRRFRPDGAVASVRGTAELAGPGLGGQAVFHDPEERVLELPAGTVFPTNYSLEMIELAESEGFPDWRVMFDGFGDAELQGVGAAMIGPVAPGEVPSLDSALLADLPSWRIRLAFFPLSRRTPEPDREQGFRVFANGVVDELVIDYGDFTIDAALEAISPLPAPNC